MHPSVATLANAAVTAATTTTKKSGSSFGFLIFLVAIAALLYLFLLRPARARQRAALELRRTVEVGDEVTTTAGLIATVVAVDEDAVTLEIAPGVHCRYIPAAILRVNTPPEPTVVDDPVEDRPAT